jgi:hypothetical protein
MYTYARNNPTTLADPKGTDVYVCLNNENGGRTCNWYSDEDYAKYAAAQNAQKQGITAPVPNEQNLGHPSGNIMCGTTVCGTVTYGTAPLQPASDLADLYAMAMGVKSVVQAAAGLVVGIGDWLSSRGTILTLGLVTGDEAADVLTAMGRPAWAKTAGGFVSWLRENFQNTKTPLTAAQADAVAAECKRLKIDIRLDPPQGAWNTPHFNVGDRQIHVAVPPSYDNPSIPKGRGWKP